MNVCGVAHKAQADPVHVLFKGDVEVGQVLFGQAWKRNARVWQVDALLRLQGSALNRFGDYFVYAVRRNHFEHELAVVEQHVFAHPHILRELRVGHVDALFGAFALF